MNITLLLSMAFTMAAVMYFLIGLHIVMIPGRTQFHWVLSLLCLALVVWSEGFAVVAYTDHYETALLWHRIASIGYGTGYSLLLHYAINLTGLGRFLKRPIVWFLLYLPAAANIVIYAIGPSIGLYQYTLIRHSAGWAVGGTDSPIDSYYYIYVVLFSLLTLAALIRWRIKSPENPVRQQFKITFFALAVTVSVGLVTDMLLTDVYGILLPEIAPLLVLIPMTTVIFSAEKYGIFRTERSEKRAVIIKTEMKVLLYKYMAFGFQIGGIMGFSSKYFLSNRGFGMSILYGATISVIGVIIYMVMHFVKKEAIKDYMVMVILTMVIPLTVMSGASNGSTTVWMIPVVLFIPFMAYSNSRMLMGLSASSILTFVVTASAYGEVTTVIDGHDYALRLTLTLVPMGLAFLVNYIYRNRLEENMKQQEVIYDLAYYDQLTGLPSRGLFQDRLAQSMAVCDRTGEKLVIALLDLDGFKHVNDSMGHDKGDLLLCDAARRLEEAVKPTDTVCRFGGDEYLILSTELSEMNAAEALGVSLKKAFEREFEVDDSSFNVTASIGLAIYPEDGSDSEKLIKSADIAMYHAKEQGKNAYVMSNDHLRKQTDYLAKLTNALFKAIEHHQLHMVYQPQVVAQTGEVNGLEALVRWDHDKYGKVPTPEFIRIAERNGYIVPLGYWILEEVFRQTAEWAAQGHEGFTVAINVSFLQLKQMDFADRVEKLMERYSIDPKRIELEITETIAMSEKKEITEMLRRFRKSGMSIAIDDFGTEFSSLGRLKDMTVDKIKIAKPFIDGIHQYKKDEAIVRTIIALAHNLKLSTIAEGVEDASQSDYLVEQHCDSIQGYYFYKPMTVEELNRVFSGEEQMTALLQPVTELL